jgi:hypothetical protein
VWEEKKGHKFGFDHVEFEVSLRHGGGHSEKTVPDLNTGLGHWRQVGGEGWSTQ